MAQEQSYPIVQANDEKHLLEKSPTLSPVSASSHLPLEPQYTAPIERWMESLAESIRSSEGSQKVLQKEEAAFFGRNAFSAYEKAQTDYSLVTHRTACTNAHKNILQKLYGGKQALMTHHAKMNAFGADMAAQLKATLLEKEAQIHQLKEQRVTLEYERAQLTAEVAAHQSKVETLAQNIIHQQMQQVALAKKSVDLAEQQISKLEVLRQKVSDLKELKIDWSAYEELLSDIKSKTDQLKKIAAEASPHSVEHSNELMLDLGKLYHRCYGEIIRLTSKAAAAYQIPLPSTHVEGGAINVHDVTIEADGAVRFGHVINITNVYHTAEEERAKAKQEMEEQCQRYAALRAELASTQRIYEETKTLLDKREGELSSLAARAHALSIEWEKQLADGLQKQKDDDAEKNKLRDQLQAKTQEAVEQSLKTEQMEKASVKQAAEQSEKLAIAQQEAMSAIEQIQKVQLADSSVNAEPVSAADVEYLLRLVVEGEQDQAESMLQQNPGFALVSSKVTDLSGRVFSNITAFQYALWALDWHMYRMILKYLPKPQAAAQAHALQAKGTEHGKTGGNLISNLIQALTAYIQADKAQRLDQLSDLWVKGVGGAQYALPVHVINEYSRPDRSFDPLPNFTEATLPRTRLAGNNMGNDVLSVVFLGGRVGSTFAFYRASGSDGVHFASGVEAHATPPWGAPLIDLAALQELLAVRTQQVEMLLKTLAEFQQQPVPRQVQAGWLANVPMAAGLFGPPKLNLSQEVKGDDTHASEADKQTFFRHILKAARLV